MSKKILLLVLILCLAIGGVLLLYPHADTPDYLTVAIVPLDSRPANTQYPYLLGTAAGMEIILPPAALLDDYLTPADSEGLWQWLEENSADFDRVIICTNELFQGGLISSRHVDSLADYSAHCDRLAAFCRARPAGTVTVLAILPRLLPSQFDPLLYPYSSALKSYGIAWDKAVQSSADLPAADIPPDVLARYRSLYLDTAAMLERLCALADEELFCLVVGQDDAAQYCPSNIIKRQIIAHDSPQVTFLHGADELTMLILASLVDLPPSEVQIVIDNPALLSSYFPYEGADLQTILAEKLAFAHVQVSEDAADTLIIHADSTAAATTLELLAADCPGYLGLADIAYANRGDKALADYLLSEAGFARLHGYSGWNTAGNTLGTLIAHYRLSQACPGTTAAYQALAQFKAVRLGEDIVYQALLSSDLRSRLLNAGLLNAAGSFTDRSAADTTLADAFSPYGEVLQQLFRGNVTLLPGCSCYIEQSDFSAVFPWNRTFEVQINATLKLR